MSRAAPVLAIALLVLPAGACNEATGASGYSETQHCTGPTCGVCPPGQRWWDESCIPACASGASDCGPICCGFGLRCVTDDSGAHACSRCESAAQICGPECCEQGALCTNPEIGVCSASYGTSGQSCGVGLKCKDGDSCCASIEVPGGTLLMGAGASDQEASSNERPEHPVQVSTLALDKYEVTVGRMRNFVEQWDYEPPPPGAGAHPRIAGSGWRSEWDNRLPQSMDQLDELMWCKGGSAWLSGSPNLPINCVTWYVAFAFCAWDGGRLPTEAEWEYAAAGGDQDRKYPWGESEPTSDLALYDCANWQYPCAWSYDMEVGSKPSGRGRWGHLDLAGSESEWVLDAYDAYGSAPSADGANTTDSLLRVYRGGGYYSTAAALRAAARDHFTANNVSTLLGFRCAREL